MSLHSHDRMTAEYERQRADRAEAEVRQLGSELCNTRAALGIENVRADKAEIALAQQTRDAKMAEERYEAIEALCERHGFAPDSNDGAEAACKRLLGWLEDRLIVRTGSRPPVPRRR